MLLLSRAEAAPLVLYKNAPAPSGAHQGLSGAAESPKAILDEFRIVGGPTVPLALPCLPLRFRITPKKKRVTRYIGLARFAFLSGPASGSPQAAPSPPKAGRRNVVQADRRRQRRKEAAGLRAQRAFQGASVHRRRIIAAACAERRERPPGSDRKV